MNQCDIIYLVEEFSTHEKHPCHEITGYPSLGGAEFYINQHKQYWDSYEIWEAVAVKKVGENE